MREEMDKQEKTHKIHWNPQTMILEVEGLIDDHCTSMTPQGVQGEVFPDGDSPIQLVNPPNKA